MSRYIQKNCKACGDLIEVRLSDHKRGWGNFCDKACAAAFKTGQRPRDVNANHAKYSPWAEMMMKVRTDHYGRDAPPKAPSIESQLGQSVKVKRMKRKPSHHLMTKDEIHDEALRAMEDGWDGHKIWS